jgi:hypothetical protein
VNVTQFEPRVIPAGEIPEQAGPDEHQAALATAVSLGEPAPAGRLFGLPELPGDDAWCDIAGASVIAGVPMTTVTDWLASGSPEYNPFPAPALVLCRLYWKLSDLDSWKTGEIAARC